MTHALKRRLDKLKGRSPDYLGAISIITEPGEPESSIERKVAEAKVAAGLPDDIQDDSLLVIIREIVSPGDRQAGAVA